MSTSLLSRFGRALRGMWWLIDSGRRALLNLLFLLLLVALAWALLRGGTPALQPKTALVLDLSGRLVEQRSSGGARASLVQRARGQDDEQTRLRDVLAVLDSAAKDPDIGHALLVLDGLQGAGLPKLREVAAAISRFKAAGKPVYAWGSGYDQRQYYLAAHATELWLHPMGEVDVQGYGRPRSYYKDLLDRVGVSPNVIRAGKFKNAGESYTANAPSPETLEADSALYNALWAQWTGAVEKARKQPAGSVTAAIDSLPDSLAAAGGNPARWALERKWVDALKTRDEMRAAMIERGAKEGDGKDDVDGSHKSFRQIGMDAYLARIKAPTGADAVGVIVAEGSISAGRAGPGSIGGESTAQLVRQARDDKRIKALVLRVDSPGGSVFGSELVRRELELTRQAGKPVVVSMGDLAASGGYWISLASDEIIADPATVTGSIGVIAMLPTAQGTLDKLGVHTGGVTTTWLGAAYDRRSGLSPRYAQLVQTTIDHVYRDFTERAAAARKTTPEKIDAVAQGRVWVGQQALDRGLVDRLGSYGDALQSAATRAKLGAGYRVQYIEAQPGRLALLLQRLGIELDTPALMLPPEVHGALLALGLGTAATADAAHDLGWLADLMQQRKPFAATVHCLCSAP